MRLLASIALGAALLATSACTPAHDDATDAQAPAANPGASKDGVPTGAAGEIAASQVGRVSPVPAFQGGGADWSVEILSLGDMRHSVKLASGDDVQAGTAVYQPTTTAPPRILLAGTLHAAQGDRALRITLTRGECRDAGGAMHPHGVRVDIAGAAPLQGCGDLAMY